MGRKLLLQIRAVCAKLLRELFGAKCRGADDLMRRLTVAFVAIQAAGAWFFYFEKSGILWSAAYLALLPGVEVSASLVEWAVWGQLTLKGLRLAELALTLVFNSIFWFLCVKLAQAIYRRTAMTREDKLSHG